MRLQNTVMQLRKVCSHPFLFDWPIDPNTRYPVLGEELVNASGKMMVLDRLLRELFRRGHKVLLFSQFTTMLDIIEVNIYILQLRLLIRCIFFQEWAVDYMGWTICRIDGSTSPLDRREEMNRFQNGGDDPDAPRLFLLSTRAGGLGINLVAADTVIFYDQDWVNLSKLLIRCLVVNNSHLYFIRILKWMLKHKTERIVLARLGQCLFSGLSVHTQSKLRSCSARRRSASWRFSLLRKVN
jgi:hypothetical protein